METINNGSVEEKTEPDNAIGILTFDELLEDDYYKSEFEKRVNQRLEDTKNSHPDVKER